MLSDVFVRLSYTLKSSFNILRFDFSYVPIALMTLSLLFGGILTTQSIMKRLTLTCTYLRLTIIQMLAMQFSISFLVRNRNTLYTE